MERRYRADPCGARASALQLALEAGLRASYGNCQAWSQMQCAMKAYLEHGINLREGMYK